MITTEEKLSNAEIGRRGDEIYDRVIRSQVEPEKNGQIVAIDVHTGDWEISEDGIEASHRLHARNPNAQGWQRRVGSRYLAHFGGRLNRKTA